MMLILQDFAHQVVIGSLGGIGAAVIDRKLHQHQIGLIIQHILLYPVCTDIGTGGPDPCIDKRKFRL